MGIGPRTGAGDGNKEYKAMSDKRGMQTGSRYEDEKRRQKNRDKEAKHAAKLQRKKGYGL